jgi:putative OPT family oligopeptide transporter
MTELPQTTSRELTMRSILTGMILASLLSVCNVYTGLKIGWSINMSVTAALLSYAFWQGLRGAESKKDNPYGILETNISQTAASAGASVSSAGLVAPIPALAMLTGGQNMPWWQMSLWVLSVTLVGIVVSVPLRRQMLEHDNLPFPLGVAAAETLKEIYAKGSEAVAKVWALFVSGIISAGVYLLTTLLMWGTFALPGKVGAYSLKNLGFSFSPHLLMYGVGGIIGLRAGVGLLLGAIIAHGFVGEHIVSEGWVNSKDGIPLFEASPNGNWGSIMRKDWLLWPGVAILVVTALTSFALSWKTFARAFSGLWSKGVEGATENDLGDVPNNIFIPIFILVAILSVVLQMAFFDITWWLAIVGVLLSFVLAIVAARASGETGITPVGGMGKVTQLTIGGITSGAGMDIGPASNLMTANVTGGAASQCGDMLHDLRCGLIIGAKPKRQFFAQMSGVLAGAMVGSMIYLVMIPKPLEMLGGKDWDAPAVMQWKAVAELFAEGFDSMAPGTVAAMIIAGIVTFIWTIGDRLSPARVRAYIPSITGIGLAFMITTETSFAMFVGALVAWVLQKRVPNWTARFLVSVCAGLIAGESLTGAGISVFTVIRGSLDVIGK